jgi:MFS family permease
MVWRDPVLRSTAGIGVVLVAVFTSLDEVLAPNLALASGLGAYALSAFLSMTAGAALIGCVLFAVFAARFPKRTILLGGVALMASGLVGLASLPAQVGLAIAPLAIGLGIGPLWPLVVTMIHRRIPVMQRGRVFGSLSAIVMISQPAAALLAGPTVVLVGPHATTVFVAALVVAVAVAAPFVKGLRGLDDRSFGET